MSLSLHRRQRAATRVCFEREPRQEDLEALGSPERWLLYRTMVRDRLRGMVEVGLRRTLAVVPRSQFEEAFATWLHDAPPRTRYIREVTPAFAHHVEPTWSADPNLPSWTVDLLRYETARWECWYAEAPATAIVDFGFDRIPVLNPALRLVRTAHPVQRKLAPEAEYPAVPTHLCVYRTPDNRVDVWVLNDVAADLMSTWQEGDTTVTAAVRDMAARRGVPIDARLVDTLSDMLAKFIQRGILWGSRP